MALLSRRIESTSRPAVRSRTRKNRETLTAGSDNVVDGEDPQLIFEELDEVMVVHSQSKDDHDQEGNDGEKVATIEDSLGESP